MTSKLVATTGSLISNLSENPYSRFTQYSGTDTNVRASVSGTTTYRDDKGFKGCSIHTVYQNEQGQTTGTATGVVYVGSDINGRPVASYLSDKDGDDKLDFPPEVISLQRAKAICGEKE